MVTLCSQALGDDENKALLYFFELFPVKGKCKLYEKSTAVVGVAQVLF